MNQENELRQEAAKEETDTKKERVTFSVILSLSLFLSCQLLEVLLVEFEICLWMGADRADFRS